MIYNRQPPDPQAGIYRGHRICESAGSFIIARGREILCTKPSESEATAWIDRHVDAVRNPTPITTSPGEQP